MAHECPVCHRRCFCCGDIDDDEFDVINDCECCDPQQDYWEDEFFDDYDYDSPSD